MAITHNEMVTLKMNLLGGMNQYIIESGNEEVWADWISLGVPDEATEDDLRYIAEDEEEWCAVCGLFGRLIKRL